MSDWIRPAGCEGGGCVEYRTVGDDVFIRSSRSPHQCAIASVAEWDAFVVGLTAEVRDESDFYVAHVDQMATLADSIAEAKRALAAENARLRQQRDQVFKDLAAEQKAHRSAVAEAAVLRHRDRRTQAVVAVTRVWHHACGRTVGTGPGSPGLPTCECGDLSGWVTYSNSVGEPLSDKPGSFLKVRWTVPGPRVWNAGDPEPEGVETVRCRFDTQWQRTPRGWYCVDVFPDGPPSRRSNYGEWKHLRSRAPLTEVLPGPSPVTIAEGVQVALDGLHEQEKRRADLADREAGRAGEAQCPNCGSGSRTWRGPTGTWNPAANPPCVHPWHEPEMPEWERELLDRQAKAQDCTEGLDAAIEAAQRAATEIYRQRNGFPADVELNPAYVWAYAEAAVRAASPLIERAALETALRAYLHGAAAIAAERRRQVDQEGWTSAYDRNHFRGELAQAAACYAWPGDHGDHPPAAWPWLAEHWKPSPQDRIRELVKAGALIAAEIDRLTS